ncbi:MAG: TetR family transcriptional regulator [Klenkia sp.]|nr:TetR family transcriptional regulator [Klenkia sp.]
MGTVSIPVREQQRRDSWSALQAAALDLVGRYGFTAVTADDIATAAGVSRRTFFNHFPTKAAALFDPHPDDADRLTELLAEVDTTPGLWAALRAVCLDFVAGYEAVLPVRRRLVAEDAELDVYHRTAHRHVGSAVEGWTAAHLPGDPLRAALLAEGVAAVLITAFRSWQPDDDPAVFADLVARGFDVVGTGLAHQESTPP